MYGCGDGRNAVFRDVEEELAENINEYDAAMSCNNASHVYLALHLARQEDAERPENYNGSQEATRAIVEEEM